MSPIDRLRLEAIARELRAISDRAIDLAPSVAVRAAALAQEAELRILKMEATSRERA